MNMLPSPIELAMPPILIQFRLTFFQDNNLHYSERDVGRCLTDLHNLIALPVQEFYDNYFETDEL